jgi:hypothetical protein
MHILILLIASLSALPLSKENSAVLGEVIGTTAGTAVGSYAALSTLNRLRAHITPGNLALFTGAGALTLGLAVAGAELGHAADALGDNPTVQIK